MTSLFTVAWLPTETGQWLQVLFDIAIKSLIILLLAKATIALLKNSSASARHLVWSVTVSALLILPALTVLLPDVRFPVLPTLIANTAADARSSEGMGSQAGVTDTNLAASVESPNPLTDSIQSKVNEERAAQSKPVKDVWAEAQALPPAHLMPEERMFSEPTATPVTQQKSFPWAGLFLSLWFVGVLAVTLRFLSGFVKVWHIAHHSMPVAEISWVTLARSLSNRLGLRKGVKVLKSDRVTLPMTWGALRSVVLLPEASDEWSLKCRSIVLLHELAHVKRRDCLTQTFAQLVCAIYWFNPMVWFAAQRLRVERELACDDEVLQAGTRPSDYASYLVEIASSFGANVCVSPFAVGMACSELENRVRAILNPDVKRHTNNRLKVALSSTIAATIILPLATIQPWVKASTLNEKLTTTPEVIATQADAHNQEHILSDNASTNDREILRSIDAIKASLQTDEASNQHTETNGGHHTSESSVAQELLQPAALIEGQGTGAGSGQGIGEGKISAPAQSEGYGNGQGSGSGFGSGSGSGNGQGAGTGTGLGSGQGEKPSKDLTADEMIKLRMYSVTPEFTEAVRKMGFDNVTVDQIIQLKVHNVDDEYVKLVRSWGYDKVAIRDLVNLKVAGVTGDYVAAMKNAGFEQPTVRQVVSLKISRVTPEFIEAMRRAGYDKLSLNQVMSLRNHNINEEFIRHAESWTGGKLTLNQLMQIKVHNLTPAFANEVKAMGFDNVPFMKLLEVKIHGINSDYVREMRSLGFDNLTLEQLLRMKIHGVTSDFVKKMRAAGFKNVSINQLIEMRLHGIDDILLKNSK
jgi:beta-lactamase regulating signal transducer with metallopeptidase domain